MAAAAPSKPLVRAVIVGASGRMGQELLRAAPGFARLLITGAVAWSDSLALGRDAGELAGMGRLNLPITSELPPALAQADVVLDFSHGDASADTLEACRAARKPLLLGTTGFGTQLDAGLDAAAGDIAVLVAPNTSLAVALLGELTRIAAQALPATFDVDVLELHHRLKRDAPSGTALALADAAARARGIQSAPVQGSGRPTAPRTEAQVGIASLRAGDIIGEHTVLFCGAGEELTLSHRAHDRGVFARGALSAALWLSSKPPGRYAMRDFVLRETES